MTKKQNSLNHRRVPQNQNPEQQQQNVSVTQVHQRLTISPFKHLPPPEECEHFERIIPGFCDRVLSMAEAEIRLQEKSVEYTHAEKTNERNKLYSAFKLNNILAITAHALFTTFATIIFWMGGTQSLIISVGIIAIQMMGFFVPEIRRARIVHPQPDKLKKDND